ncbi:MAG: methyltransferase domain-containing protein [Hyphomicrobiales bacterium]
MATQQNPTTIIDKVALRRNRERARFIAKPDADFLVRYAADDLALRLSTITKPLTKIADLNNAGSAIFDVLQNSGPDTDIIQTKSPTFAIPNAAVCDDDIVPFTNSSFDLIASVLNLQFVDDLPGTLIQIRRALRPDGLFLGMIMGGSTLQELRQSFLMAEAELTGGASARVLPFIDVKDAGHLLQRAGFALPVTDTEHLTVRYDHPTDLMRDLRAMGATNCVTGRSRNFLRQDVFNSACEQYVKNYSDADGRIRATFEIISMSGWAPHENQQKPLKPGSAKISLKDVL